MVSKKVLAYVAILRTLAKYKYEVMIKRVGIDKLIENLNDYKRRVNLSERQKCRFARRKRCSRELVSDNTRESSEGLKRSKKFLQRKSSECFKRPKKQRSDKTNLRRSKRLLQKKVLKQRKLSRKNYRDGAQRGFSSRRYIKNSREK